MVIVQERLRKKSLGQKKEIYSFFLWTQKPDIVVVTLFDFALVKKNRMIGLNSRVLGERLEEKWSSKETGAA